ncbi:MAG: hypothetical protein IPJ65_31160 [Archangiaceae bacterium]|nr:hypothetical protein [Archangiaceae bacterium]
MFSSLTISGSATPSITAPESAIPVCVRVTQIGALPLTVEVDGLKVQFTEWMAKDVDASELIGFRVSAPAPVHFVVRSGRETFEGQGNRWVNPHGVVGSTVHPIDSLEVCR